ncbi:ATP-binding protein [Candidatus Solincola tengchongensis]|uniref:ATP-binding protein n=1 Tax=Candidatus Solincola tengchongensis TaxID=2900693 RepID=UPI00257B7764|nr:ATP-binding protein [Candidatus Solincola tengchongensis]
MNDGKIVICIVGDVIVDWQILLPRGESAKNMDIAQRWGQFTCQAAAQPGGAALLTALLQEMAKQYPGAGNRLQIHGPVLPDAALQQPGYPGVAKAFMSWSTFEGRGSGGREYVWRVSEFLGEHHSPAIGNQNGAAEETYQNVGKGAEERVPYILVIEDSNHGFRNCEKSWPSFINTVSGTSEESGEGFPRFILIKVTDPLEDDPLLERLCRNHAQKLIAFTSVSDLRKSGCHIGYPISWEQVYEETVNSVTNHPGLKQAKRVVVSLGASGAVLLTKKEGENEVWDSVLVFDPKNQEGDWEKKHKGDMIGYGICIEASLIWKLVVFNSKVEPSEDTIEQKMIEAIKRGCHAARILHLHGYDEDSEGNALRLSFPCERIALSILGNEPTEFQETKLAHGFGRSQSILDIKLAADLSHGSIAGRLDKAKEVVIKGAEHALRGVPLERIGQWSSVDREEIESMRSVSNIVEEYVNRYRAGYRIEKPLSIAVFGPPGAGKSFAIKQMAKANFPDLIKAHEFNLSQLVSPNELAAAFHIVRDMVLEQYLPLVFWDEFDTTLEGQELGWLRHFLAPMQDGHFREGGAFHPIGPSIFVFAGSRYTTMEEFRAGHAGREASEKAAKKDDFVSRLKGFVNILGPNPRTGENKHRDENYILRRAFLLRTILERKTAHLMDDLGNIRINDGVLRAFLMVERYYYGTRSMEAIVEMSTLAGKKSYELSSLPAPRQLSMHVDPDDFMRHACTF